MSSLEKGNGVDGDKSGVETDLGGWRGLPCRSFMKSLLGPLLVAQLVREGLWYAGSRGNRQEMFVIRGFPSHKLPSFADPAAG